MWTTETVASVVSWKSKISMAHLIWVLLLMPLAGCSGDGAGGPIISSLSTPTDATAGLDSDQAPDSAVEDSAGEEDPIITMTPTPTGVTAQLTWDRPANIHTAGYVLYYGKRSSDEPTSEESDSEEFHSEESAACSRGEHQAVEAPPATITGLEPNTQYVFAIRAFNESESLCSNEITAVTPPAQS